MPVDPAKIAACDAAAAAGASLAQMGASLASAAAQEKAAADAKKQEADVALAAAQIAQQAAAALTDQAARDLSSSQTAQQSGIAAQQAASDAKAIYGAAQVYDHLNRPELAATLETDADALLAQAQALIPAQTSPVVAAPAPQPVEPPAPVVPVAPPVVDGGQGNGSTDPGMGATTGTPGGIVADAVVA